jgi:hypothetical protein
LHAGNVNEAVAADAQAELFLSVRMCGDGTTDVPSDLKLTYSLGTVAGVIEINDLTICGVKPTLASQKAGLPVFQHINERMSASDSLTVMTQLHMPAAAVNAELHIQVNELHTVCCPSWKHSSRAAKIVGDHFKSQTVSERNASISICRRLSSDKIRQAPPTLTPLHSQSLAQSLFFFSSLARHTSWVMHTLAGKVFGSDRAELIAFHRLVLCELRFAQKLLSGIPGSLIDFHPANNALQRLLLVFCLSLVVCVLWHCRN